MSEHILFLTGKLAEAQLRRTLEDMAPSFRYSVQVLGVSVAALMTADMIQRRLQDTQGADRILVPGRCRGDLNALSTVLGIPVERGPEELHDLPYFFGKKRKPADLSRYDLLIFAEIVDAPRMSVGDILRKAHDFRKRGANVIDLGCIPSTPFPHLTDSIAALKAEGFKVSVDSLETDDLLAGGMAGADYLLSLNEETLWIADRVSSIPVIIPSRPGDMTSLHRAIEHMQANQHSFLADPILDPIHFGFTASLVRYHTLRQRYPDIEIMMGVGNLTELTHADTAGINAMLLGVCSELGIRHILATEVSRHARNAVGEADLARRIYYAAHQIGALPRHFDDGLMALHERSPFPSSRDEIEQLYRSVRDPSFRIQVSADSVHVYNRHGFHSGVDPFEFYPHLNVEHDGGHAFYLGVELARAQIAWQLGKRYTQDQMLLWGCQVEPGDSNSDPHSYKPAGSTMKKSG